MSRHDPNPESLQIYPTAKFEQAGPYRSRDTTHPLLPNRASWSDRAHFVPWWQLQRKSSISNWKWTQKLWHGVDNFSLPEFFPFLLMSKLDSNQSRTSNGHALKVIERQPYWFVISAEGSISVERDGEFRCVCDMISSLICRCASVWLYIHVVAFRLFRLTIRIRPRQGKDVQAGLAKRAEPSRLGKLGRLGRM